jgi:hypothetical protein
VAARRLARGGGSRASKRRQDRAVFLQRLAHPARHRQDQLPRPVARAARPSRTPAPAGGKPVKDRISHASGHRPGESRRVAIGHQRLLHRQVAAQQLQLVVGDRGRHHLDRVQLSIASRMKAPSRISVIEKRATKVPACGTTSTSPSAASRATASATGLRDTPRRLTDLGLAQDLAGAVG